MYKKILFVICMVSISLAQTLVPYRIGDKWGYAEYGTTKLVIPTIYDYAKPFANDMGMVKVFDKWGFIDRTGNNITPIKYDFIEDFFLNSYTSCKYNEKYGVLNCKGVEIIPAIYTSTLAFSTGYIKMYQGDSAFYFDTLGNSITEQSVQNIINSKIEYTTEKVGEKNILKDKSGKIITKRPYKEIYDFKGRYIRVNLDGKFGVIDKNGNEVIPLVYDLIYNFEDGMAICKLNGKYGLIDTLGKIIEQTNYDDISIFNNNMYLVELNNQPSLIDYTGKEIVPFGKYSSIDDFFEGLAKVAVNGKYGFIDTLGNEVISLQYEDASAFIRGLAKVKINGKTGLIDKSGKIVIQPKYGYVDGSFKNGIVGVDNSLFTYYPTIYLDTTGQEYVGKYTPPKYGKHTEVSIWNTETRKIKSKIVNNEYTLFIYTPRSYKQTNMTYPVVYLLDADYTFGIARDAVESMIFGKDVPEMIVVGIAYAKTFDDWFSKRTRDLTPTNDTNALMFPGGGGCDKFLQFINHELIPFVDKNFRVAPNERTLLGYSFGGLFGFYTMFKSPELFNRYLIISPSLWWDNKLAFNWETEYAKTHFDLKSKIVMTYGENEWGMGDNVKQVADILKTRNYPGLNLSYWEMSGLSHTSVFPAGFVYGMKAIFK